MSQVLVKLEYAELENKPEPNIIDSVDVVIPQAPFLVI
jgi:hypothetical protein